MPTITRPDGAEIYYEVHGTGDPVLCVGGWGTFCHGGERGIPFGLIENYQVILLDYRGIAESTDNYDTPATMEMYAGDAIAILDELGLKNVHLLGMVGIGACVCNTIAIQRPDLARSLVNTGAWCKPERMLNDQLNLFVDLHRDASWEMFQRLVCAFSFTPEFYAENIDRLLGPDGAWGELRGRIETHQRFIDASVIHDVEDELRSVETPALIFHAPLDLITTPAHTGAIANALPNAREITMPGVAHVIAGKEQRSRFSRHLFDFWEEIG